MEWMLFNARTPSLIIRNEKLLRDIIDTERGGGTDRLNQGNRYNLELASST